MVQQAASTPQHDPWRESHEPTTPTMHYRWGWRVFAGSIALGFVLAVVFLALGILALRLLVTAESMKLLPKHVLNNALRSIGIRSAPFALSLESVLLYSGFFLGMWIVLRRIARASWRSIGWRAGPIQAYLAVPFIYVATLICAGIALAVEAALFFHGRIDQINNPKINAQQAIFKSAIHPSVAEFLLLLFSIAIIAPIVEEMVFRGMLFQLLRRHLPLWAAVILSALVFAVLHFIPVLLPVLFVFGVALALVFHYSRSLHCSILLHMLINAIAVIALITRP